MTPGELSQHQGRQIPLPFSFPQPQAHLVSKALPQSLLVFYIFNGNCFG